MTVFQIWEMTRNTSNQLLRPKTKRSWIFRIKLGKWVIKWMSRRPKLTICKKWFKTCNKKNTIKMLSSKKKAVEFKNLMIASATWLTREIISNLLLIRWTRKTKSSISKSIVLWTSNRDSRLRWITRPRIHSRACVLRHHRRNHLLCQSCKLKIYLRIKTLLIWLHNQSLNILVSFNILRLSPL